MALQRPPSNFAMVRKHDSFNTLFQNTSLGYFSRESIEEVFVVMSGSGRMTVADETFPVKQYDGRST